MKRKTYQTIAALLACSAVSAGAQQAVVGWDFSQFAIDGFSTLDNETVVGQVDANFSTNANSDEAFGAAHANGLGTLYYDGSFGSSALGLNPSAVEPNGGNDVGTFGFSDLGASGQINALVAQGQANGNAKALGFNSDANGQSFVFEIDISSFDAFQSGRDWVFSFVGFNTSDSDDASSITWEWSADGSVYSQATTTNLTPSESRFDIDLGTLSEGALDGEDVIYVRGTLGGVTDGLTFIDNVGVSANAAEGAFSGSLFILNNPASDLLVEDWYFTPMGTIFVGSEPWLWSLEFGWHYSLPENDASSAFVFIQDAPFATWVYVDQASASEDGFWGFAFDAANADVNGWFYFFNDESASDEDEFFLWDDEGEQFLSFDDAGSN